MKSLPLSLRAIALACAFCLAGCDLTEAFDLRENSANTRPDGPTGLSINTFTLGTAAAEIETDIQLSANGGEGPYVWSALTDLPPGMLLDHASGELQGAPTSPGAYTTTYFVRDSNLPLPHSATKILTLTVVEPDPAALRVTSYMLAGATAFSTYEGALSAAGGAGPYTWSTTNDPLPQGLELDPAGRLVGLAEMQGQYRFRVSVRDSNNQTTSRRCVIDVAPQLEVHADAYLSVLHAGDYASVNIWIGGGKGMQDIVIDTSQLPGAPLPFLQRTQGEDGTYYAQGYVGCQLDQPGVYDVLVSVTDDNGAVKSAVAEFTVLP